MESSGTLTTNAFFYEQLRQIQEMGGHEEMCQKMWECTQLRWEVEFAEVSKGRDEEKEPGDEPTPFGKEWCVWCEQVYRRREWEAGHEEREPNLEKWFEALGDLQRQRLDFQKVSRVDDTEEVFAQKWQELMRLHSRQDLYVVNMRGLAMYSISPLDRSLWSKAIPQVLLDSIPGEEEFKSVLSLSINKSD